MKFREFTGLIMRNNDRAPLARAKYSVDVLSISRFALFAFSPSKQAERAMYGGRILIKSNRPRPIPRIGDPMEQTEIYAKLSEIFHDLFDDPSISLNPEMTAADVPEWDSFNHINLIVAIETEFRIKFQTAELETMHNVGALVDRIDKKVAEQGH
jgi:acyl carrier protein